MQINNGLLKLAVRANQYTASIIPFLSKILLDHVNSIHKISFSKRSMLADVRSIEDFFKKIVD